jgi:hypothetical protein
MRFEATKLLKTNKVELERTQKRTQNKPILGSKPMSHQALENKWHGYGKKPIFELGRSQSFGFEAMP